VIDYEAIESKLPAMPSLTELKTPYSDEFERLYNEYIEMKESPRMMESLNMFADINLRRSLILSILNNEIGPHSAMLKQHENSILHNAELIRAKTVEQLSHFARFLEAEPLYSRLTDAKAHVFNTSSTETS